MENIKCLEILADQVYIEFTDNDSDYISYHKAKQIIKESNQVQIPYSLADSQRAIDFIHSIPFRNNEVKGEPKRTVLVLK